MNALRYLAQAYVWLFRVLLIVGVTVIAGILLWVAWPLIIGLLGVLLLCFAYERCEDYLERDRP